MFTGAASAFLDCEVFREENHLFYCFAFVSFVVVEKQYVNNGTQTGNFYNSSFHLINSFSLHTASFFADMCRIISLLESTLHLVP